MPALVSLTPNEAPATYLPSEWPPMRHFLPPLASPTSSDLQQGLHFHKWLCPLPVPALVSLTPNKAPATHLSLQQGLFFHQWPLPHPVTSNETSASMTGYAPCLCLCLSWKQRSHWRSLD